ncbi:hypothetical protein HHI36_015821, partial [Cryptolaemus montrouzieri]
LFCLICLLFVQDPVKTTGLGSSHTNHIAFMFAAYTGFFLINFLLILNRYFGERIPYKTASIYALLGSTLFLVTAILLIVCRTFLSKHYGYTSNTGVMVNLTMSSTFAFVNCVIFSVDAIYTFKRMDDF